jgi:transcriptional regulator, ArsR family
MEKPILPHDHHSAAEETFDHMPAPEAFEISADLFKLLSDPTRIRLFWILCHCEECLLNLSVMMNMSSPALSHHLKLLKACGLIVSRREGKEVHYRAADNEQAEALHHVIERVAEIACPV